MSILDKRLQVKNLDMNDSEAVTDVTVKRSHCATPRSITASETHSEGTLYSVDVEPLGPLGKRSQLWKDFWRKMLIDAPLLLDLPIDYPRPQDQSFAGAFRHFTIEASLKRSLMKLAVENELDMDSVILAGWSVVLARLSNQCDIIIGISKQSWDVNRDIKSALPLRVGLSDDPVVTELLARIRASISSALSHGGLTFLEIVESAGVQLEKSHAPLYQAAFQWRDGDLTRVSSSSAEGKLDLEMYLQDQGDNLEGKLCYAASLFNHETIERHSYLRAVLTAMVFDSPQHVGSIDILSVKERQSLLHTWNESPAPYPTSRLIHHLFQDQVNLSEDAVAVVCQKETISYSDLNSSSNRLAHHLIGLGVKPDALVGLCVERSPAMVVGILAILKAGGAYVPLDPLHASGRLLDILSDASPLILIADKTGRDVLGADILSSLTVVDPMMVLDGPATDPQVTGLTAHNLAYAIYTSGSTGKPKGVLVEHAQVTRLFDATASWYQFNGDDAWCMFHSFTFDVSIRDVWGALRFGGRLVLTPHHVTRSPEDLYRLVYDYDITVLNTTPSAFELFIEAQANSLQRDRLRYVILAGEALDAAVLRPWFASRPVNDSQVINMYGPTEITVYATYRRVTQEDCSRVVSPIDVRLPDLKAYNLDNKDQPVPLGTVGELCIGGADVARGYLNKPELTADRFPQDPFSGAKDARMYRTKDLVRYLSDGSMVYLGRNDDQVKIRGFRIEVGEIKSRLMEHALVAEAAVISLGEGLDKSLVAYVVARPKEGLAYELRSCIEAQLQEYMMPTAFVRLNALPLTANGKLDRRALPKPQDDSYARQE
ncbi:hypothetical protein EC968_005844 [Mortierella alpina]|nr:hypothetical protein EC968_005844 [Mortierella alpina]